MRYDRFQKEVRYIKKERAYNVFFVSFFALILGLMVIFGGIRFLVVDLLLLAFVLLFLFSLLKNNRLLRQFATIIESNTESLTYEVTLHHPKVTPLLVGESRGLGSGSSVRMNYYGVEFKAPDKKKYYYFLGECRTYDKTAGDKIKSKFDCDLTLQCYQNSTVVRTIENDPYFLRINL